MNSFHEAIQPKRKKKSFMTQVVFQAFYYYIIRSFLHIQSLQQGLKTWNLTYTDRHTRNRLGI